MFWPVFVFPVTHQLAGSGMVLVQINYRVNLFGFYAIESLSEEASSGVGN